VSSIRTADWEMLNVISVLFMRIVHELQNDRVRQFREETTKEMPRDRKRKSFPREPWNLLSPPSRQILNTIVGSRFRSPLPLPRITRSRTFSVAARDRRSISWQRRSKGRSASEARRSSRTTDRRILSLIFTARSGQTRTIHRKITTSWRWLTSLDAASSRETWVIERSSELRGMQFLQGTPTVTLRRRLFRSSGAYNWRCTNGTAFADSDRSIAILIRNWFSLRSLLLSQIRFVHSIGWYQASNAVMIFREEIASARCN